MGRYASEHGTAAAVRKYKTADKPVNESTIRGFKNSYEKELKTRTKQAINSEDSVLPVISLPAKTLGRPLLLGKDLDSKVQDYIRTLRAAGGVINHHICVATARGIIQGHNRMLLAENGGHIELSRGWALSLMERMHFVKRRGCSKCKMDVVDLKGRTETYLSQVQACVEMESIPDYLVINWDQTGIHLIPSSSWTMEKEGTRRVEIEGFGSKSQITAVFGATLSGDFLPVQVVYAGKTVRCHPKFTYPDNWHITHSANHWSNSTTMDDYLTKIIIPYVKSVKEAHNLRSDQTCLLIFDVFKGQMTPEFLSKLLDNNFLYVLVPPNCTDLLQPLDLSVNKSAKDQLRGSFQDWYAMQITGQVKEGKEKSNLVPVDLRTSIVKPLSARWLVSMYDYFKANPQIIVNGFKEAGIINALNRSLC